MGMLSRQKGKAGERELARLLSDLTGHSITRRVRQHDGDDDLVGLPGWSVEGKRYAAITPGLVRKWWEQAQAQGIRTGALPVLFYRQDRGAWCAVWPASLHLPNPTPGDHAETVTGEPSTWWRLVQHLTPPP